MIVKENQPRLRADTALVFTLPPVGDRQDTARTVDIGHGRIEQRTLTTSAALVGYSDWPGLAQVFELGRHVITQKTGEERVEVVYGVTSLSPERATPEHLLALVRGQWQIENKSHWVRDVTFDEDRSQVRCGNIPQVLAALRNTTLGLLRWAGYPNMAAACRRLAAQPVQALALIGIELPRSKLRGIKPPLARSYGPPVWRGNTGSCVHSLEQPQLDVLAMQLRIGFFTALLPDICANDFFIPMTTYGTNEIPLGPTFATP